jgi:haloalkane dehalogenase
VKRSSLNRFIALALSALALVAFAGNGHSQQAQAKTPVTYQNLEFPKLPWASRWIEIDGVKMHYIDIGDPKAAPVIFLHGIPTWLYIWRNIIPEVIPTGRRIIAVDFVGFGRSDKPATNDPGKTYSMTAQSRYLEGFIDALKLKRVTLVLQDLGSAVGFDYAARHEGNVRGIAFMESAIPVLFPPTPESFKLMDPALAEFFNTVLPPGQGEEVLMNQNFFIEGFLQGGILRKLSAAELNAYRAPFPTPESRLSILWGGPRNFVNPDSGQLMANYATWLPKTRLPMLMLYVKPGAITPEASVSWAKSNVQNLETVFLGAGGHFVQEDYPQKIGQSVAAWLRRH